MSNRILELFSRKPHNVLSVYCTAGYPTLNDTVPIIQALEKSGADLMEIGIPFSDPVADGPVIQASSTTALHNGMTLALLFEQLRDIRTTVSMPLILMGYINPVLQYGLRKFCQMCAETGIDGVIIPDLPLEEYERSYMMVFREYSVFNILLVTPQTPDERIRRIDEISQGFVYAVSSAGTTGKTLTITQERKQYFERLQTLQLRNPILIGFGISDSASFAAACQYTNGGIVGSAFISMLAQNKDYQQEIPAFISGYAILNR